MPVSGPETCIRVLEGRVVGRRLLVLPSFCLSHINPILAALYNNWINRDSSLAGGGGGSDTATH